MNKEERRARAQLAANTRWAKAGERPRQSETLSKAFWARMEVQVDPQHTMDPDERVQAMRAAARAQAARMHLAKAKARRARKPSPPAFRPLRDARAVSAYAVEGWFTLTVKATLEDGAPQSADALLEVIADKVDGLAVMVPDRDQPVESALYRLTMTAWGHAKANG